MDNGEREREMDDNYVNQKRERERSFEIYLSRPFQRNKNFFFKIVKIV